MGKESVPRRRCAWQKACTSRRGAAEPTLALQASKSVQILLNGNSPADATPPAPPICMMVQMRGREGTTLRFVPSCVGWGSGTV